MMRDQPGGAELLAQSKRVLTSAVLPHLPPDSRYQALMVIRAMDLAERELRAGQELERHLSEQLRQLVAVQGTVSELHGEFTKRLRTGAFDASEALHSLLGMIVAFRLRETDPSIVPQALDESLDRLSQAE